MIPRHSHRLPVSRLIGAFVSRSPKCARLCSSCDRVGCNCADRRRLSLLRMEAALHAAIAVLSCIGLLGLFPGTLQSFPWARYSGRVDRDHPWLKFPASGQPGTHYLTTQNISMSVHINIWGGCAYSEALAPRCLSWRTLRSAAMPSNATPFERLVQRCGHATKRVRLQACCTHACIRSRILSPAPHLLPPTPL